jgi:hypothetical protein
LCFSNKERPKSLPCELATGSIGVPELSACCFGTTRTNKQWTDQKRRHYWDRGSGSGTEWMHLGLLLSRAQYTKKILLGRKKTWICSSQSSTWYMRPLLPNRNPFSHTIIFLRSFICQWDFTFPSFSINTLSLILVPACSTCPFVFPGVVFICFVEVLKRHDFDTTKDAHIAAAVCYQCVSLHYKHSHGGVRTRPMPLKPAAYSFIYQDLQQA